MNALHLLSGCRLARSYQIDPTSLQLDAHGVCGGARCLDCQVWSQAGHTAAVLRTGALTPTRTVWYAGGMLNMIRRLRAQLREHYARRWNVPEIPFSLERLAKLGFQPELIFDAGAYKGDFARLCLAVWPGCSIACFEALEARDTDLRSLTNQEPSVRVFRTLLGAKSRTNVPLNTNETVSSVFVENGRQDVPVQLCKMRTVDEVVALEFGGHGPDFLKLDVQGYELEILKGAEQTLAAVKVILLEGNFLDIYRGVPLFSEIVGWLAERGWVAYDICGIVRRPLDNALWQADFIFVPEQSFLRAKKHWG